MTASCSYPGPQASRLLDPIHVLCTDSLRDARVPMQAHVLA